MKVAINGFDRIGRAAFKRIIEVGGLELAAINDLAPPEDLAYLLMYNTAVTSMGTASKAPFTPILRPKRWSTGRTRTAAVEPPLMSRLPQPELPGPS